MSPAPVLRFVPVRGAGTGTNLNTGDRDATGYYGPVGVPDDPTPRDDPTRLDEVPISSADLERIQRWETAGGTWVLAGERPGSVTISLCRCDGGEEAERMTTADPAVRAYVRAAGDAVVPTVQFLDVGGHRVEQDGEGDLDEAVEAERASTQRMAGFVLHAAEVP